LLSPTDNCARARRLFEAWVRRRVAILLSSFWLLAQRILTKEEKRETPSDILKAKSLKTLIQVLVRDQDTTQKTKQGQQQMNKH
jgi:hypothetical protein